MGTSAGALAGSLYCAGYSPQEVARLLSDQTPASLLRPSLAPWRGGALSLEGVVARLRELLPPRFEDLQREFAVGVVTADGRHLLLDSGPLPEAVAASAAIPFVFQPVDVPGRSRHGPFKDGGVVDRVGLKAWRDRRRAQLAARRPSNGVAVPARPSPPPCVVHVIERSSPFSGLDDTNAMGESRIVVVRSPRSGASFFDLGTFDEHMAAATQRARPALAHLAAGEQRHQQQQQQQQGRAASRTAAGSGSGSGSGGGAVHNGNGTLVNGYANGINGVVAVNGMALANGAAVNGAAVNGVHVNGVAKSSGGGGGVYHASALSGAVPEVAIEAIAVENLVRRSGGAL